MYAYPTFEVLARYPLWYINEKGEAQLLQNKYDDLNVIRCYGSMISEYTDIPIEEITICDILGIICFKNQTDAIRFSSIINTEDGINTIMQNAYEKSKHSKNIIEFQENIGIKNGIYCIPYFDEDLPDWSYLPEIRYLNEENLIKKPIPFPSDKEKYISTYLTFHDNIENKHDFSKERILFEIYSEKGKTYINHFFLHVNRNYEDDILYQSRILNYKLFQSKESAYFYRERHEHEPGFGPAKCMINKQLHMQNVYNAQQEKASRIDIAKKIGGLVGNYLWSHSGELFEFGKKHFKKKNNKTTTNVKVEQIGSNNGTFTVKEKIG